MNWFLAFKLLACVGEEGGAEGVDDNSSAEVSPILFFTFQKCEECEKSTSVGYARARNFFGIF